MRIPEPWEAIILVAAIYRIWRLLAEDDILDSVRRRVVRLGTEWKKEGDPVPDEYRSKWVLFLTCPWCLGGWLTIIVWLLWQAEEHWTMVFAGLFALMTGVGITRGKLDPPE